MVSRISIFIVKIVDLTMYYTVSFLCSIVIFSMDCMMQLQSVTILPMVFAEISCYINDDILYVHVKSKLCWVTVGSSKCIQAILPLNSLSLIYIKL